MPEEEEEEDIAADEYFIAITTIIALFRRRTSQPSITTSRRLYVCWHCSRDFEVTETLDEQPFSGIGRNCTGMVIYYVALTGFLKMQSKLSMQQF